jgi:hypothetical protein
VVEVITKCNNDAEKKKGSSEKLVQKEKDDGNSSG